MGTAVFPLAIAVGGRALGERVTLNGNNRLVFRGPGCIRRYDEPLFGSAALASRYAAYSPASPSWNRYDFLRVGMLCLAIAESVSWPIATALAIIEIGCL